MSVQAPAELRLELYLVPVRDSRAERHRVQSPDAAQDQVSVSARYSGLVELVDSAGVLVEPGNADHLAQVLNALLHDPERRAELARRGRARADAFRIDGTVDRYHSLYREVCRAPADRRASPA